MKHIKSLLIYISAPILLLGMIFAHCEAMFRIGYDMWVRLVTEKDRP